MRIENTWLSRAVLKTIKANQCFLPDKLIFRQTGVVFLSLLFNDSTKKSVE